LRYEAECLTSQLTKQNLKGQLSTDANRTHPYRASGLVPRPSAACRQRLLSGIGTANRSNRWLGRVQTDLARFYTGKTDSCIRVTDSSRNKQIRTEIRAGNTRSPGNSFADKLIPMLRNFDPITGVRSVLEINARGIIGDRPRQQSAFVHSHVGGKSCMHLKREASV